LVSGCSAVFVDDAAEDAVALDGGVEREGPWVSRCSREELGGRFLGLMAYLDSKG
jgi:hypothetical protein